MNWHALQNNILFVNERGVQLFTTEHFGTLSMSVGRIVQTHALEMPYKRGEEKSYFCFGGSAVVVFGERGAWCPADDVLSWTRKGVETYLRLGDPLAFAAPSPAR